MYLSLPIESYDMAGVYFIWNGRRVKIGWSVNIRGRINQMQIENDETLKLIGYINVKPKTFQEWLGETWPETYDPLEPEGPNNNPRESNKIDNTVLWLNMMYKSYYKNFGEDVERKHQQNNNDLLHEAQWFNLTVEQARKTIENDELGILPEKYMLNKKSQSIRNHNEISKVFCWGWEDIGDFFVVNNMHRNSKKIRKT